MPLNLASPGIVVREVDLTNGRVDATSTKTGGLAAPFAKGPVESPQLIETEADLLDTYGQPYPKDNHYEYWLTASSFLAYGGVMRVVRADDEELKNGFVGAANSVKIKWFNKDAFITKDDSGQEVKSLFRSFFDAPNKIYINSNKLIMST